MPIYNEGGPAAYAQTQQSRQDDQFRQLLQMMMMGMQQKTQQGQYSDQMRQQELENLRAGEKFKFEQDKFRQEQEVDVPYRKAMTEDALARAEVRRNPPPERAYSPDTVKNVSGMFKMSPDAFSRLNPITQDKYFTQYMNRTNSVMSEERSQRKTTMQDAKSGIRDVKNDIEGIGTYYGRQGSRIDLDISTKKASDMRLIYGKGDMRAAAEKDYEGMLDSMTGKYGESKNQEIMRRAERAVNEGLGRIGTDQSTGKKYIVFTDGTSLVLTEPAAKGTEPKELQ